MLGKKMSIEAQGAARRVMTQPVARQHATCAAGPGLVGWRAWSRHGVSIASVLIHGDPQSPVNWGVDRFARGGLGPEVDERHRRSFWADAVGRPSSEILCELAAGCRRGWAGCHER